MLIAIGLIAAALAGYAALCAASPFGYCRKCSGTGLRELRKRSKLCRRCRGQRRRLRVGRRLFHAGQRGREAGSKYLRPAPK
ncbi:hypothetical protein GCM10012287_16790 [Streptomyces daqingensis]|uniref:Uncharacterized protein n=1 Tax=Streptomyces daqingensis TaxID=1472640 RepID=A0ABQ2M3T5_9ACTN|nr:hypothetical protein GCM10012287_16790 [Streptomyces daqingensis]